MARSLQEIMNSADQMAADAERGTEAGAQVQAGDEPWLDLKLAAFKRAEAEKELARAIASARQQDMSWAQIGKHVGITGEAVRRRYGDLVGPSSDELMMSIRRSVGSVPAGGRIDVSTLRSGKVEVTVRDRTGRKLRRVRKPQVVLAIARLEAVDVKGARVPVQHH